MSSTAPVLGIGELLWDLLPDGPRLGGAPFNATVQLARLGHEATFVSAVGDDDLGRRARAQVEALGVDATQVAVVPALPTGTVEVDLDDRDRPRYTITRPAAWEALALDETSLAAIVRRRHAAVVLGTLAQTSPAVRAATRVLIEALPDARVVYDVNLRDGHWTPGLVEGLMSAADVLRCNEDEWALIGGGDREDLAVEAVMRRHRMEVVAITRGVRGATGWDRTGRHDVPGHPTAVADTVGAGDAFTAGLLDGLLGGEPLEHALRVGNALGALVAKRSGALAPWRPAELRELLDAG